MARCAARVHDIMRAAALQHDSARAMNVDFATMPMPPLGAPRFAIITLMPSRAVQLLCRGGSRYADAGCRY